MPPFILSVFIYIAEIFQDSFFLLPSEFTDSCIVFSVLSEEDLSIHFLPTVEVGPPQVYAHKSGIVHRTVVWKKLLYPF